MHALQPYRVYVLVRSDETGSGLAALAVSVVNNKADARIDLIFMIFCSLE
jgi:hypothetical protein